MQTITLSRRIDASPEAVREAISDLKPFMEASGFDDVVVETRTIDVANRVGIASIELTLELVDEPNVDLAYEQRDGIFDEMRTTYTVKPISTGSEVSATTDFSLNIAVIGNFLDSTLIKRQRRKELTAQFDWLEARCVE